MNPIKTRGSSRGLLVEGRFLILCPLEDMQLPSHSQDAQDGTRIAFSSMALGPATRGHKVGGSGHCVPSIPHLWCPACEPRVRASLGGEPGPDSPGNLFWAASSQGCTARPPPKSETLRPILLKAVLNPEDVHGNIHPGKPSFFSSRFNSYSKLTHLTNIRESLISVLPVLTHHSDGVDSKEHTTTTEGFFFNKIKH